MRAIGDGPEVLLDAGLVRNSSINGLRLRVFQKWQSLLVMALAMAAITEPYLCNRLQQDDQQQQSRIGAEQGSSIDQAPVYYGGSNGDYSAVIGDNLVNYGAPLSNGKRARKVSGFMPMRGRKDGRDQLQQLEQRLYQPQSDEMLAGNPFRDNDGDANILKIVTSTSGLTPELRWINARQGQFANQFAAQHLLASEGNRDNQRAGSANGESLESAGADLGQQSLLVVGDSMMQAKLRRAFHPMRGKKSYGSGLQLIEPAGFADEPMDSGV